MLGYVCSLSCCSLRKKHPEKGDAHHDEDEPHWTRRAAPKLPEPDSDDDKKVQTLFEVHFRDLPGMSERLRLLDYDQVLAKKDTSRDGENVPPPTPPPVDTRERVTMSRPRSPRWPSEADVSDDDSSYDMA